LKTSPCANTHTQGWPKPYIYGVYTVFWQGNHQRYGHIRCIYTVLADPTHTHIQTNKALTAYITQYTFTRKHTYPAPKDLTLRWNTHTHTHTHTHTLTHAHTHTHTHIHTHACAHRKGTVSTLACVTMNMTLPPSFVPPYRSPQSTKLY